LILYTPLPLEIVMKDADYKPSYLQIPFSRGFIEVELISPVSAKVVRILSNDLNDYLQPHLQPGSEIKLRWVEEN